MEDTQGEAGGAQASIHHDDLLDENGEYDADAAKVKSSAVYRYLVNHLACPALEEQPAFIKLRQRVLQFHITSEKYRMHGPTQA